MRKYIFVILIFLTLTIASNSQTLKDVWVVCNAQGCKVIDPYYSDGVTLKWEGSCTNGKADGYGKLTKYDNGELESTYEGTYRNGIREGNGKFTTAQGTILEGIFVNNQMTGIGSMHNKDGDSYYGEFINYMMHGKGTYIQANGGKFEGFVANEKKYTGKYTRYDGQVSYYQKGEIVPKITDKPSDYKPQLGVKVTEYFDENWNRCKQKEAAYYRLITYESPNTPKGVVKDYYINGHIQSDFFAVYLDYDDEGKMFYEGEATWYYQNGKIKETRFYFNNNKNGRNTLYYEDGQKGSEIVYDNGSTTELKQWYKTGKLKTIANYEDGNLIDGKYIDFDENGAGTEVHDESFDNNSDEWTEVTEIAESHVEQDALVLEVKKDLSNEIYRLQYIKMDQKNDFSIEAKVGKYKGDDTQGVYGIRFGYKDENNFFDYVIIPDGRFTVNSVFEGVINPIVKPTAFSSIKKGSNQNILKIFKVDNSFIFSINNEIVAKTEASNLRGNEIGLVAYHPGIYTMQNFVVKEFLSDKDISKKSPNKQNPSSDNTNEWKGNGSGFFINEKGYIATNHHVIEDAKDIQVEFYQKGVKQIYKAKVIVSDKQNDLAIIKIDDRNFKTLPKIPFVFNTTIKDVGTEVFALGYPIASVMGEEVKFTDGKISAKTGIQGDIRVYQISTPIQPGNSGGPLFDIKGNLIGITSSALNKEYFNSENVNYAIKCTYLKNLIDAMPETINTPNDTEIYNKSLTEKIKVLSEFVPIIKIR